MFPLKDDIPTRSVPIVTIALMAMNVIAFLYQLSLSTGGSVAGARAAHELILEFGLIPCRLTGACDSPPGLPAPILTVFTSMFLHAGLFHIGGNMMYLWIFGDSVEDTLGHGRFLAFYLLCGTAAAGAHALAGHGSTVPMVGASGAVSGILGAYLRLFPHARVLTLVIVGIFVRVVRIPALVVLGFWIVVQFLNGLLTSGAAGGGRPPEGGVAWFAHIAGFVAGLALLSLLAPRRRLRPW